MFFTKEKLAARIRQLEPYRYRDRRPLQDMVFQLDRDKEVGAHPPTEGPWQPCAEGQSWRGEDLFVWLHAKVLIPMEWANRQVVGRFDFGKTGPGYTRGFESLLFVNEHPYQGVDTNHQEVFFEPALLGTEVQLDFRLWSGLPGGGKTRPMDIHLTMAELCWLDPQVDDFFYTAWAVLETIEVLDENRPECQQLTNALNRAFLEINWTRPGSDAFYQSIGAAHQCLQGELQSLEKHHPVTVTCIGHTHIDVAWLWRLKHTQEKCARSFSTVLRLMERYPEYVFLQSQPQLYQYIQQDYPQMYQQIQERVAEGRWEADGAMWVEADCNIVSGESLVRQILYGSRFLKEELGVTCKYLWLPDVFGYSWALPQILRRSGIETFMTTKISWNQYNQLPHDTFRWRGMDGTEILTHFITTPTLGGARFYTYNGDTKPFFIQGIWDNYRDKQLNQELLLAYGHGDGGGGVTRDMLEMRRRLAAMPGLPQVKTDRVDHYFDRLQQTIAQSDGYVHTWDGELYLEYHRGTYTSQAQIKWFNRKLELALREQEWLETWRSAITKDWCAYPAQDLLEAWRTVLLHQFHDIIPGSSIREVYEDTMIDYQRVAQQITTQCQEALKVVAPASYASYAVFNSGSWPLSGLVHIPLADEADVRWEGEDGKELLAIKQDAGWLVAVDEVPSLGYRTIKRVPKPVEPPASPFCSEPNGVDTPYYAVRWNESGQLTRIYDRLAKRDVLAPGARGNVLQVFEDRPMAHDAWDIDIYYQEKMEEVGDLVSLDVVENNRLRYVVRSSWRFGESTLHQDLVLYSTDRRIDFVTEVDWRERQQLLKVAFPVDIRSVEATYDIQFGNVKRPTHWNTSWDWARFESVGHQWADLSEEGYGVSLLNDCKYGYDIKDQVLRLSLLKSAIHPDHEADQGVHRFTYALWPHQGRWLEGGTVQAAWALNQPLRAVSGHPGTPQASMFTVEGVPVIIDAVKKAEDGCQVVLRFHEYGGARGVVTIHSALPIACWQECNLMEVPEGAPQQGSLEMSVKPYEIKTVLLTLEW